VTDEYGPGEIRRGFDRIEKQLDAMQRDVTTRYNDLADRVTSALGPVSELRYRAEMQEKDIEEIAEKVRGVEKAHNVMEVRAAGIAGGATAIVFFVKFLLGR
jgi:hypothetical protein